MSIHHLTVLKKTSVVVAGTHPIHHAAIAISEAACGGGAIKISSAVEHHSCPGRRAVAGVTEIMENRFIPLATQTRRELVHNPRSEAASARRGAIEIAEPIEIRAADGTAAVGAAGKGIEDFHRPVVLTQEFEHCAVASNSAALKRGSIHVPCRIECQSTERHAAF